MLNNWTPEDDKLVILAKGSRSRVQAESGAALRDETGRTYASAEVSVGHLNLSAVEVVVAQAVASGSTGIEAIVLCAESGFSPSDIALVKELAGSGVPLHHVTDVGVVTDSSLT